MSQEVAFSGRLPGEETNGLKEHAKDLLDNPRRLRLIIAVVDVQQATQKFDKNIIVPRLQVRHIELVSERNVAAVQKLLVKELSSRTGMDQLPFPEGHEANVDEFDADGTGDWPGDTPEADGFAGEE